jgi:EmrB/QacA subfamily drug resistance transporter
MPPTEAPAAKKTAHPNLILAICCTSLLLVSMDVTIVNVAMPAIQRDLHATYSGLQWVFDAYTLVVASLLILSGALSDRFGRRRVFQTGLVLFTAGSLLCGTATTIGMLVAFRALQGLGASMLNPVALSIIVNVFTEPKARGRAIGIWGAVAGISFALGPLIGGALTQTAGWRFIFRINLPIGLLALILAALYVPESKAAKPRAFDPIGQLLVFVTLASLTYAVIEGPHHGWTSPMILGLFTLCAVALAAFVFYEPRLKQPLLDLRFFRSVPFTSATLLAVSSFSCFAGFLFLNAFYLQQVRGFSPFHTGLYTLPLALMMVICAPLSGQMVGTLGPRPSQLLAGTAFLISSLLLTSLTPNTSLGLLVLIYLFFGVGLGMINPAIANSAVAGMPLAQAGVAAAIASTSRQVGAALGVAVSGTVLNPSHMQGSNFTQATSPIWWIMVACSLTILILGWASNTQWAKASTTQIAYLFADPGHN